ncbi:MAG TPA: (d)CMP kinase [Clostridiales bacterium]|nr:(d)CMP kinase [Clostridiales bacterium]
MIAIAIDGPAGAGKSTIAKTAARELGYIYVDTGALYRSIGLNAKNVGTNLQNDSQVRMLLNSTKLELRFINNEQRVLLNGNDVSDDIRTPEVSMMASKVSAIPAVRAFLLDLQRNMAVTNNVIMDGRDIGTVVLPKAQIKIFLTASPECRATRRYDELKEKGMDVNYSSILEDIQTRDYNDSHRAIAPLKPAPDSILVDTSDEALETSVGRLISIIKERLV